MFEDVGVIAGMKSVAVVHRALLKSAQSNCAAARIRGPRAIIDAIAHAK
jgi:hypothetical protein